MDWFTVDKEGLAKLLARKGPEYVILELLQNAWDERATAVDATLERIAGSRYARIIVVDDNPAGFADLSSSWRLFAESAKKADAQKRGRFNLGEKLVLAACTDAEIITTTGGVRFDASGRKLLRARRDAGSSFSARLKLTAADIAAIEAAVDRLIVPPHIRTRFNGRELVVRPAFATVRAALQTEIGDAGGHLRRSTRQTDVDFLEPRAGEAATLYEMGIPVVETGGRFHANVQQKVPMPFDRDGVSPAYLARLHALELETCIDRLTPGDAGAAWVKTAVAAHGAALSHATIEQLTALRFGDKRVSYDPSDPEANGRAVAAGYKVIPGGALSKAEWERVRAAGAILPAGQVTPSARPYSEDGDPLTLVDEADWTPAMHGVAALCRRLAPRLIGREIRVRIATQPRWPYAATYGSGLLTLNLGRLGHRWFAGPLPPVLRLLIHELGHERSGDHLSDRFHGALCEIGGKMAALALEEPALFAR